MRKLPLRRLIAACLALIPGTFAATDTWAQGAPRVSPLAAAPGGLRHHAVPAVWEWVYWVSGGTRLDPDFGLYAGVTAELTHGIITYEGLPGAIYLQGRSARAELRLGPWVGAATRPGGGLVEGGLTLDWGGLYHAPLGSLDLRGGIGHGAFGDARANYGVVSVAYGVRSALGRYSRGPRTPIPAPRLFGMAAVARLFFTYRAAIEGPNVSEVVLGVELSPTFLLPPNGGMKLLGGPPS